MVKSTTFKKYYCTQCNYEDSCKVNVQKHLSGMCGGKVGEKHLCYRCRKITYLGKIKLDYDTYLPDYCKDCTNILIQKKQSTQS